MNADEIKKRLAQYRFYHIIKLEEGVYTPGEPKHLGAQHNIHTALKSISLEGKRVLDIGCRDGLFCFEAERRGASEVIGIDNNLSPAATEFLIPYFNSKVKMFCMNLYDLTPEKFGKFDVVLFAGVLYHLRYPFWALKLIRDVTVDQGRMIIETGILDMAARHPLLYCPTGKASPYEHTSVSFFNMKGLSDTLSSLGISTDQVYYFKSRNLLMKLKYGLLSITPSPIIKMFVKNKAQYKNKALPGKSLPVKRATLLCSVSADKVDQSLVHYWDGIHRCHSDAVFI